MNYLKNIFILFLFAAFYYAVKTNDYEKEKFQINNKNENSFQFSCKLEFPSNDIKNENISFNFNTISRTINKIISDYYSFSDCTKFDIEFRNYFKIIFNKFLFFRSFKELEFIFPFHYFW